MNWIGKLVLLLCCYCSYVGQSIAQQAVKNDNMAKVKAYVAGYNSRDLDAMLALTHQDINWMSVEGSKVVVATADQAELAKALRQQFSSGFKAHSSLSDWALYGDFVSAIEKVSWQKDGIPRSACSLSVYQFDSGLIKAVWYYPAQSCVESNN